MYAPAYLGLSTVSTPLGGDSDGDTAYNIGWTYQETNALSGASLTGTSPSYNVIHSDGRRLSQVSTLYGSNLINVASGASATNIAVFGSDNDYLFVNVDTGTAHFPDPAKIVANNPFVTGFAWLPVSTANVPELVVEVHVPSIGRPNLNVDPSLSAKLLVSSIPDDVGVTMSAPANQADIGSTAGTDVYVTWELTGLTANEGFAFSRIWLTSNQTASELEILDITIDTASYVIKMDSVTNVGEDFVMSDAAATAQTSGGITQFWRYWPLNEDISTDITNTLVIPRGSADADSILVRVHARTSLSGNAGAAGDHGVTIVLNVRAISAGNSLQTAVSDTVILGQ